MFTNLAKLATIGLLLPVSTVVCERGLSALTRVKTNLRNRLSVKTLNHLLVIAIEGPSPADYPYDKHVIAGLLGEIEGFKLTLNYFFQNVHIPQQGCI